MSISYQSWNAEKIWKNITRVKNHVALFWIQKDCIKIIIRSHSFAALFPTNGSIKQICLCALSVLLFSSSFMTDTIRHYTTNMYVEHSLSFLVSREKNFNHIRREILFVNKWILNCSWLLYSFHSPPLVSHLVSIAFGTIHSRTLIKTLIWTVAKSRYSYVVRKID